MTTTALRQTFLWLSCLLVALVSYRVLFLDIALVMPVMEQHLVRPIALYGHIFLAPVALALVPFQFWTKLRTNRPHIHRFLGRVYITAILIAGLSSLWLATTTQSGTIAAFGFGTLGIIWLVTTGIAWRHATQRNFAAHKDWMIRSAALTFAAVTLRLQLPIGIASLGFDAFYQIVAWSCWVPNLIVAEWIIRASKR